MMIAIQPFFDVLHLLHLLLRPFTVIPEVGSLRTEIFLLVFYLFSVDIQIAVERLCAFQHIL